MNSTKKKLIKNLTKETYCRIKPDSYGGVGVFAVKDIPKSVNPFMYGTGLCPIRTVDIPDQFIKKMDPGVQTMINDFYGQNEDGTWSIPKLGLNGNDISFYLNTSKTPNLKIINSSKCSFPIFKTMRPILNGEELLIDYDLY